MFAIFFWACGLLLLILGLRMFGVILAIIGFMLAEFSLIVRTLSDSDIEIYNIR